MINTAYSIYDVKSRTYSNPFFTVNDATAKRIVAGAVTDLTTTIGQFPQDYVLYKLATMDAETGVMIVLETKEHICDVISLVPISHQIDMFKKDA